MVSGFPGVDHPVDVHHLSRAVPGAAAGEDALVSQALTDRLSVRGGVTVVVPVHLHSVVLVAWRF